jgi:hypothetical protein
MKKIKKGKIDNDLLTKITLGVLVLFIIIVFGILLKDTLYKTDNSNQLVCTGIDETDNVVSMQEVTVNFDNDKMNDLQIKLSVKIPDAKKDDVNKKYDELMDSLSNYKDKSGYKVEGSKTDDTAIVTLLIDPAQTTDNNDYNLNATKKQLKESYESQGYTCK